MNKYSYRSEEALATCHPDLQRLFRSVLYNIDHTVLCGYRGKKSQNALFKGGSSQLEWPKSHHNILPSNAIDVAPYLVSVGTNGGIPWEDTWVFEAFADRVKEIAINLEIDVIWGGDWESFKDMPHWELEL